MAANPDKDAIVERVLEGIESGITLAELCRTEGISRSTFHRWKDTDEELKGRFARARDLGFDAIADETLEIADTPKLGVIEVEKPVLVDGKQVATTKEVRHEDMLGHRKLQVETRLKLLAKWDPKRYGDRTTLAGDPEAPLMGENADPVVALAAILDAARQRRESDGSDLA
jgi:transposase-like protein